MVVSPTDTTHEIRIIPLFNPDSALTVTTRDEFTDSEVTHVNTFTQLNGYLTITFDYTFTDLSTYTLDVVSGGNIVYKGYIFATTQTPQDFKLSEGVYL